MFKRVSNDSRESGNDVYISVLSVSIRRSDWLKWLAFSLPQNAQHRKYARWKAAYIHNCLKNGETPQPGPIGMEGESFGTCFLFFLRDQKAAPRWNCGMRSSSESTRQEAQLPCLMFHSQWAAFFSASPAVIFIAPYCVIDLFNKILFSL